MPRGGKRAGAGRPPYAASKKRAYRIKQECFERGTTPLEYFLKTFTDENASIERRDWAAAQAAPYMHPRLNAVAVAATITQTTRAEELSDDALAHIAISGSTNPADETESPGKPH